MQDQMRILSVDLHPQSALLAIGTENAMIKIFNIKTSTYVEALPQVGEVHSVTFSPCGFYLAAAASSKAQAQYIISVWSLNHNEATIRFEMITDDTSLPAETEQDMEALQHQDTINCIKFRPLSILGEPCISIVSGSDDETLRVWNFQEQTRSLYREHSASITCLSVSDQGRIMISGASNGELILWKFEFNSSFLYQQVHYPLMGHIPMTIDFFPAHIHIANPFGTPLRDWDCLIGTVMEDGSDGQLKLFKIHETRFVRRVQPLDYQRHFLHGDENIRIAIFSDDEEDENMGLQKENFTGKALEEQRSFRALRDVAEEFVSNEAEDITSQLTFDLSVLGIEHVQTHNIEGGVKSLRATYHEIIPEDPWRKRYGCLTGVIGTFDGKVYTCTFSAKPILTNYYPHNFRITEIFQHDGVITTVASASLQLRQELQRHKFLRLNEYIAVSGSIDETIAIVKWHIDDVDERDKYVGSKGYVPYNFIPRPPSRWDPPLIIEPPLTVHRANELFLLRETVRKLDTQKRKNELELLDDTIEIGLTAAPTSKINHQNNIDNNNIKQKSLKDEKKSNNVLSNFASTAKNQAANKDHINNDHKNHDEKKKQNDTHRRLNSNKNGAISRQRTQLLTQEKKDQLKQDAKLGYLANFQAMAMQHNRIDNKGQKKKNQQSDECSIM